MPRLHPSTTSTPASMRILDSSWDLAEHAVLESKGLYDVKSWVELLFAEQEKNPFSAG